MMQIYKTIEDRLRSLEIIEEGVWINLVNPTESEVELVSDRLRVDSSYIKAALDEEERARIEIDNGCILILVDVPIVEKTENSQMFSTIPLGIILYGDNIITVCTKELSILRDFIMGHVKSFFTFKKTRFILQILYKNATCYLQYLKQIDRMSNRIERELHISMKNKELIQLLELEKSLVYFSTSLRSNEIVMEKMLRLEAIKKYPEDEDLLEDVIIENKQAIEMANIYSNILSGTMDAFASVISNNLNIVMKILTSITIVMAIPTMVASFFGMNVMVPLAKNPYAFSIIIGISVLLSFVSAYFMAKKKMF
ncbi:MAG: Mg2 transporter protein CorA family protein [Anaerosolibacter sp.]|jgi:magnesium transporter|uniref:magnesium transporter CorA family protein n=1 Tax=Anaerosolibacter sp. TaxID=1872527 RepID=UPI00261B27D4|nr:magnesium transporter CorA family protein [Anaerosolibacter sp.]MDF2548714.1 Mg2 transporter protein CorA family protein [Anaerosolibacter sp.]